MSHVSVSIWERMTSSAVRDCARNVMIRTAIMSAGSRQLRTSNRMSEKGKKKLSITPAHDTSNAVMRRRFG